jgi:hypothetical protein
MSDKMKRSTWMWLGNWFFKIILAILAAGTIIIVITIVVDITFNNGTIINNFFGESSPTQTPSECIGSNADECWIVNDEERTLVWNGPTDGSVKIWTPADNNPLNALRLLRDDYSATFTTTQNMYIKICVGRINGNELPPANSCGENYFLLPPNTYTIEHSTEGGGGFCVAQNPDDC